MNQTTTDDIPATDGLGFGPLPCPRCGNSAAVAVYLDDLSGPEACRCGECEDHFPLADVRALVERWAPVLRWLATCPRNPDA
jgi:hypothetical protein